MANVIRGIREMDVKTIAHNKRFLVKIELECADRSYLIVLTVRQALRVALLLATHAAEVYHLRAEGRIYEIEPQNAPVAAEKIATAAGIGINFYRSLAKPTIIHDADEILISTIKGEDGFAEIRVRVKTPTQQYDYWLSLVEAQQNMRVLAKQERGCYLVFHDNRAVYISRAQNAPLRRLLQDAINAL